MKKSKNTLYLCEFTLGLMAALLFLNLYLSRKIPASHAIHRLFQIKLFLATEISSYKSASPPGKGRKQNEALPLCLQM